MKLDDLHLRKSKDCRLENGIGEGKNMCGNLNWKPPQDFRFAEAEAVGTEATEQRVFGLDSAPGRRRPGRNHRGLGRLCQGQLGEQ